MQISEIISICKKYSKGEWNKIKIEEKTTRDQILYGNPNQECTGILVTLFASADVVRKAKEMGCNFIIVHEALFWNHGDHQDWIADFNAYKKKANLLGDICVWRNHDFIHSGILIDDEYYDGIFYGVAKELGWLQYTIDDIHCPRLFNIPVTKTKDLAKYVIEKFNLTGLKCIGDMENDSNIVYIPSHIFSSKDNEITAYIENNNIDTLISMEIVDFTTAEYIRDCSMLGINKRVLAAGHFNVEEPGMKFFSEYLDELLSHKIPINFVRSGDAYSFITK